MSGALPLEAWGGSPAALAAKTHLSNLGSMDAIAHLGVVHLKRCLQQRVCAQQLWGGGVEQSSVCAQTCPAGEEHRRLQCSRYSHDMLGCGIHSMCHCTGGQNGHMGAPSSAPNKACRGGLKHRDEGKTGIQQEGGVRQQPAVGLHVRYGLEETHCRVGAPRHSGERKERPKQTGHRHKDGQDSNEDDGQQAVSENRQHPGKVNGLVGGIMAF